MSASCLFKKLTNEQAGITMIQSNPLSYHRNLRIFYGLNVIAFSKHWSTARYWAWKIWLKKTQLFFSRKETMDVIVTDVGELAIKLAPSVRVCVRQSFCPSESFLHNSSNVVYRIHSKFYRLYVTRSAILVLVAVQRHLQKT